MKTNSRFVLLDNLRRVYSVYENKVCLAIFEMEEVPSKSTVEFIRTDTYADKA